MASKILLGLVCNTEFSRWRTELDEGPQVQITKEMDNKKPLCFSIEMPTRWGAPCTSSAPAPDSLNQKNRGKAFQSLSFTVMPCSVSGLFSFQSVPGEEAIWSEMGGGHQKTGTVDCRVIQIALLILPGKWGNLASKQLVTQRSQAAESKVLSLPHQRCSGTWVILSSFPW